jgi:hypothetical protein
MGVLPVCMTMQHMCLYREEGVWSSGTKWLEVVSCHLGPLGEKLVLLSTDSSLQPQLVFKTGSLFFFFFFFLKIYLLFYVSTL